MQMLSYTLVIPIIIIERKENTLINCEYIQKWITSANPLGTERDCTYIGFI